MTHLSGANPSEYSELGRLSGNAPIGVLDIGSNSIRLVVYERHARWLTPLHNEKAMAALGRGVAASGRLADDGVERALLAIKRFALIAKVMGVSTVHILATSAVREAENGPEFSAAVHEIMGVPVRVLTGTEEAHFAALGVLAGMPDFRGIVGDLGGGSLELAGVADRHDSVGETHALGAIRMQDDSANSPLMTVEIARERLAHSKILASSSGGVFCAIGGTWRALAKLHQTRIGYPLHMVQNYEMSVADVLALCELIISAAVSNEKITDMRTVSSSRRDLLPYGAAVLAEVLKAGRFSSVIFSALGVREGYLFGLLSPDAQASDPLLQATWEMSQLRSRSASHAQDLIDFSTHTLAALGGEAPPDAERLRIAACHLSDIGWRGHPDYRGEQSVDMVAYGAMSGIGHPGRAYLAETLAVRYMGLKHKSVSSAILKLAGVAGSADARRVGAIMRLAYALSAGMPGVLPHVRLYPEGTKLVLSLPTDMEFLAGERVKARLKQLATLIHAKTSLVRLV